MWRSCESCSLEQLWTGEGLGVPSGEQLKTGACLGWVYGSCCLQLTESSGALPALIKCSG